MIEGIEVDLLEELRVETEHKAAPGEKTQTPEADNTEPQADSQTAGADGDFEEETTAADNVDEVVRDAKKARLNGKRLAPVMVDTFDTILTEAMPFLYERTLNEGDRLAMKDLARKYRTHKNQKLISLDAEDQRVMEIYLDFEEYCDTLPLDADEKKSLIEPLAELIGDMVFIESPSGTLLLAVMMILVSRAVPLGLNYIKD